MQKPKHRNTTVFTELTPASREANDWRSAIEKERQIVLRKGRKNNDYIRPNTIMVGTRISRSDSHFKERKE